MAVGDSVWVADDIVDVRHDSIDIDRPLYGLVIVGLCVHQVVRDEIGDSHICKLPLNHIDGFLASLSNYLQFFDLLKAVDCQLLLVVSRACRGCVQADDTTYAVGEESCCHHGCLSAKVMSNQRVLIKSVRVSETGHIPRHFLISHAIMMVGLSMVTQIDKDDVSFPGDGIIQCEVAPHAPLAQKPVQEQDRVPCPN